MHLSLEDWLRLSSVSTAAVYGAALIRRPDGFGRTLAKTSAVGTLAAIAYITGSQLQLVLALSMSAVGDALLADPSPRRRKAGLTVFLAAHLFYIALFLEDGGGRVALLAEPVRNLGVAGAMTGAVGMLFWLWSGLGSLKGVVSAYAAALGTMTAMAFTLPRQMWPAMVGACGFLASDGLLATDWFKDRRTGWTPYAVWWLYYGAQAAILWAFLK